MQKCFNGGDNFFQVAGGLLDKFENGEFELVATIAKGM
jgi:hypothetical protein